MKSRTVILVAAFAVAGAIGVAAVVWLGEHEAPQAAAGAPAPRKPEARAQAAAPATWPPPMPNLEADHERVALTPLEPAVPAAMSLAQARENGDARTPPIERDAVAATPPTAAELADPSAHQAYEARQNLKLYSAFVQAAETDIPKLRDDISRGRAAGIGPDQIAKVEEKLRRIEAMRASLLKEHSELARK